MPDPKGDRLIVNLGASQARKRLRGFGCGVRKVQTGGKGQAVIIHTAKGHNLQALKNLFADVGYEPASESQAAKVGSTAAGNFAVGDVVVDRSDPARGRGIVAEDAMRPL